MDVILRKLLFVLAVLIGWQAFGAIELNVVSGGELRFDGGKFSVAAYRPGWGGLKTKVDWKNISSSLRQFALCKGENKLFDGEAIWKPLKDGSVRGTVSLKCVSPADMQCLALSVSVPSMPVFGLGDGTSQEFELPVAGGRKLLMRFDSPIRYHSQDSRRWGAGWSVRFGSWQVRRAYAVGEKLEWTVTLSSPEGLSLRGLEFCTIARGARWMEIDNRKDVRPGSALDFSSQGLQDAPAGKHGWLKNVGGHFEFERLPGVEQRFYGVNLCFTANYPSHDVADMLVTRLVRCGYNSIRIHHHDGAWAASEADRDKLDYLIAKAIKAGLYITTDLYVSRPVKWRDIGINREGEINKQLYKTYIGVWEPASRDWCGFAKAFLEHVNPYTGRAYRDEPAMPLISLVNEGLLSMAWEEKKNDEKILAAWREFGGKGDIPHPWRPTERSAHLAFSEWINAKVWEKCSGFVRSLGAKALLSNDNNGQCHGEGEGIAAQYDYVDNHFYVDHPAFLDIKWRLPSKCGNTNPLLKKEPKMFYKGYAKGSSKPYTITEWNFSGPGRYRGVGGIMTGAFAAEQEWDGLWRFAYSHSNRNLGSVGQSAPGYFDCVSDPLIAASDRASVCLYLRRDASEGSLKIDKESGTMVLDSPRTCGGFTSGAPVEAGALSFAVRKGTVSSHADPATIWVSSLDGKPVAESSRMVLTHLTDVQGEGTKYLDDTRTVLLKWGKGCLVEKGMAEISLRVKNPAAFRVWALDTDGSRRFPVACRVDRGAICFAVSTHGADGKGVMFYEIVSHGFAETSRGGACRLKEEKKK